MKRSPFLTTQRHFWINGLLLICSITASASPPTKSAEKDKASILLAMQRSADDWNRGDILGYATLYKDAPDILLVGPSNLRGFEAAVRFFQQNYDTPEKRGLLTYSDVSVQPLEQRFATVTGHFHLERTATGGGDVDGFYLLVFEKTSFGWKLVRDDSSVLPKSR